MDDPEVLIGRALAREPEAVHALVMRLCPALQPQVNAGLLARGLVDRADRHAMLDMMRHLLGALFAQPTPLQQTRPATIAPEAWAAQWAGPQIAQVLNSTVALPPDREPGPAQVQGWWQAICAGQAEALVSDPAQAQHALMVLRPLMEHEHHALAAELLPASHASAMLASPPAGEPRGKSLDKRQKRGLVIAAAFAVVVIVGAAADRVLSDPFEDLVPAFSMGARAGLGGAPAIYKMGDAIEVRLKPEGGIDWSAQRTTGEPIMLGVDAFARHESGKVVNWSYTMSGNDPGAFVLKGIVGKTLPVNPGAWDLYFVIGPRRELEILDTSVAIADEAPPPPFERLHYPIKVIPVGTQTGTRSLP